MKKEEIYFYGSLAIGTALFEIGNNYGLGICLFIPAMLAIMYFGWEAEKRFS